MSKVINHYMASYIDNDISEKASLIEKTARDEMLADLSEIKKCIIADMDSEERTRIHLLHSVVSKEPDVRKLLNYNADSSLYLYFYVSGSSTDSTIETTGAFPADVRASNAGYYLKICCENHEATRKYATIVSALRKYRWEVRNNIEGMSVRQANLMIPGLSAISPHFASYINSESVKRGRSLSTKHEATHRNFTENPDLTLAATFLAFPPSNTQFLQSIRID